MGLRQAATSVPDGSDEPSEDDLWLRPGPLGEAPEGLPEALRAAGHGWGRGLRPRAGWIRGRSFDGRHLVPSGLSHVALGPKAPKLDLP